MLEATVFICGALAMILEMTGARVLAPHVGTSAIVWTSLIGVVLAFMALGAWAGGRFADKKLSMAGLGQALAGAGAGCALPAFCHAAIGNGVTALFGNLYAAAAAAAICVFALPAFFFGMIAPYAIRLKIHSVKSAGSSVGSLYALSTAGSILGTFLGGFVLISWLSSSTILWSVSIISIVLSLLVSPRRPALRLALLAVCFLLCFLDKSYARFLADRGGPQIIESPYNVARVMRGLDASRGGEPVVLMATDPGYSQSGMLEKDPSELYFDYTRFYALGPALAPGAKNVLMLGGGGYSVPKWLLSGKSPLERPEFLRLTVVEIDPAMTGVARKYFGLPEDARMTVLHEDARAFLNRQTQKYDLVFVDVFNSHYSIPFQMGSLEAVKAFGRAVAPGGALLMNVISAVEGENGRLFRSIWQNVKSVFPQAKVYCVSSPDKPEDIQNLMIVARIPALDGDEGWTLKKGAENAAMSPAWKEIESMALHEHGREIAADTPPLLDNFAPVERYALMLAR